MPAGLASHSSWEKVATPAGKWPQKMMLNAQTLRTRFAVALPARVSGDSGPVSAGNSR